jgi:ABC-2 type transport system ATP-binding protein
MMRNYETIFILHPSFDEEAVKTAVDKFKGVIETGAAQALLNEPKLLICDEPTSALDPKGRKEILDILQKVKGKSTVIFSTHILSDVERICDEVAVLHGGKIVLQGTLSELRSKHRKEGLVIEFMTGKEKETFLKEEKMNGYKNEAKENGTGVILYGLDLEKMQLDVYEVLIRLKMAAVKIEVMEPTMENLFLEVVK